MRKFRCDYHYVDDLVFRYEEAGGYAIHLSEGSLASGDWILYDDTGQKKCYYIYEYALNSWSSCQIVQVYYGGTSSPRSTSASSRRTTSTPKPQREQSLCKFNQIKKRQI